MATDVSTAWVLNLDADVELASLGSYTPRATLGRVMEPHVESLRASLLAPDDVLVDEATPAGCLRGVVGRAFCPTPRAVKLLRRAGADPEPHPPAPVLRRVNSRRFASSLGQTLPGAVFVTELDVAEAALAEPPAVGADWRVKRAFGFAGRAQRVMRPGRLAADDRAFLRAAIKAEGVQIEPHVRITDEFALHGFLHVDGSLQRGVLVRQSCSSRGAWLGTERADASAEADVSRRMHEELDRVGSALFAAGYFGPFGVDAFRYTGRDGEPRFQPRSEINARYTMGFSTGFGAPPAPRR